MALVRYCGLTLIALTMLPISKGSLIYGSDNAGKSVHLEDEKIYEKMKKTARRLNLKGHFLTANTEKMIWGPGDIEGHIGKDGLHYVLDYARVYPPAAMVPGEIKEKSRCLFRLLRPELVFKYTSPLSSDAFTAWGRVESEIHNEEVRQATQFVLDSCIPTVAELLINSCEKSNFDAKIITKITHLNGVNIRYLGLLRRYMFSKYQNKSLFILREMVARVIKSMLEYKWRDLIKKYHRITPDRCIQEAVVILNAVIMPQTTEARKSFWNNKIRNILISKFPLALLEEEMTVDESASPFLNIQPLVIDDWDFLFSRISSLTGIVFSDSVKNHDQKSFGMFTSGDIVEIRSSVRQMSLVDFSFVMANVLAALNQNESQVANRLFNIAIDRLDICPEVSFMILRNIISLRSNISNALKRMKDDTLMGLIGKFVDVTLEGAQKLAGTNLSSDNIIDAAIFLSQLEMPSATVLGYIEKSLLQNPQNFRPYTSAIAISCQYFKPNLNQKTQNFIEIALDISDTDPSINFNVGLAYILCYNKWIGDDNYQATKEKALKAWRIVATNSPSLFDTLDTTLFKQVEIKNSNFFYQLAISCLIEIASEIQVEQLNLKLKLILQQITITSLVTPNSNGYQSKHLDYMVQLGPFPKMTSLWQFGTYMDSENENSFINLLEQCPNLKSIRLEDVRISDTWLSHIPSSIIELEIRKSTTMKPTQNLKILMDRISKEKDLKSPSMVLILPSTLLEPLYFENIISSISSNISISAIKLQFSTQLESTLSPISDQVQLLSLFGSIKENDWDLLNRIILKLPKLLVLDLSGCDSDFDNEMWHVNSPTLQYAISKSGTSYYFSGSNQRTFILEKGFGKPAPFSISINTDEWEMYKWLKFTPHNRSIYQQIFDSNTNQRSLILKATSSSLNEPFKWIEWGSRSPPQCTPKVIFEKFSNSYNLKIGSKQFGTLKIDKKKSIDISYLVNSEIKSSHIISLNGNFQNLNLQLLSSKIYFLIPQSQSYSIKFSISEPTSLNHLLTMIIMLLISID